MDYLQWLVVVIIVVLGLVGGYYHQLIISDMKEGKAAYTWFGGWVFCPEHLDENGKRYRKIIIACWVVGMALAVIAL